MPTFFALIAQSVEHAAVNRRVVGSSPTIGARKKHALLGRVFLPFFTRFLAKNGLFYVQISGFGLYPFITL